LETAVFGKPKAPRSLRISVVKDDKAKTAPAEDKELRPETVQLVAEKSKEVAKYVALTAVAAYAAVKTIDTLSKIAVKKTKSADNNQ
jgi:cobalamin biosynthesis protein CbiG